MRRGRGARGRQQPRERERRRYTMAFEPLLNAAIIALDLPSVCPRDVAGETSRGAGSLPAAASTVVPAALPGPELPRRSPSPSARAMSSPALQGGAPRPPTPQAGHLNKARRPEPPSKPSPSPASHRTQESMRAPYWIQATGVVFGFRRFRARWVAFYRSAQPWKSCAWERGRSKLYRNCCRQFFKSKLLLRSSKAILGYLVGETREREAEWTSRQSG